ncbi:MAG: hypothetical protein JNM68_15380, partial [Dinghuibacter sp.]|nr:hypothetical protein [Dinghuibacter sp.]
MNKKISLFPLTLLCLAMACSKEHGKEPFAEPVSTVVQKTNGKTAIRQHPLTETGAALEHRIGIFTQRTASAGMATNSNTGNLEAGEAIALIEAALNYEYDAPFNQNYETFTKEISFSVPLIPGTEQISGESADNLYSQFATFITEHTGSAIQLQLVDISAQVSGNEAVFTGYGVFFMKSYINPCGNIPDNYQGYAVGSVAYSAMLPCNPYFMTFTGVSNMLSGRLNCEAVMYSADCPHGIYWTNLQYYINNGAPGNNNPNASLYSSNYESYTTYCTSQAGFIVLTGSQITSFRNAINTESIQNKPTPQHYVLHRKLDDQYFY